MDDEVRLPLGDDDVRLPEELLLDDFIVNAEAEVPDQETGYYHFLTLSLENTYD